MNVYSFFPHYPSGLNKFNVNIAVDSVDNVSPTLRSILTNHVSKLWFEDLT